MANFYVRKTGADANAGTSAGAAWLTIAKALGASGIASGDTLWIGAGVYRENVTVAMTSATATTNIYGDVTGANTGDAGEVRWTAYTVNDTVNTTGTNCNLAARDYLYFQDINFILGGSVGINALGTPTSTNITFKRCGFTAAQAGVNCISITPAASVVCNWLIDSCVFYKSSGAAITMSLPTLSDIDENIIVQNCIFVGGSGTAVAVTAAGVTSAGGVLMYNCTVHSGSAMTTATNISTTYPCKVYNCMLNCLGSTALNAATSGQIIEDYNIIKATTARTNVTAGTRSIIDTGTQGYAPLFYTGIEYIQRGLLVPFGMPMERSPYLGYGNQAGTPSVDILNNPRPTGTIIIAPPYVRSDYGTATAGANKTLTNTNKTWGTNAFAGFTVYIVSGTGSGQAKTISSNTATILTVDGNWKTNPDSTSVYQIYLRQTASTGTATAGSTTTLTDSNAAWGASSWIGFTLSIDTGTGSGQTFVITVNTATVLTFAAGTAPDATSTYSLYRATNTTTVSPSVGAYEGALITPAKVNFTRISRRNSIEHTVLGKPTKT